MNKRYNTEFYHAVDKLCIKNGLTHRELANIVGISEITLSRYLTGERKISLYVFMSMCKAFKITAEDLYEIYLFSNMEQRVAKYREKHETKGKDN